MNYERNNQYNIKLGHFLQNKKNIILYASIRIKNDNMENPKKPEKDFRITWRLLFFGSIIARLLSDIAYPMSLSMERKTSDRLGFLATKLEKKSQDLKQKRP